MKVVAKTSTCWKTANEFISLDVRSSSSSSSLSQPAPSTTSLWYLLSTVLFISSSYQQTMGQSLSKLLPAPSATATNAGVAVATPGLPAGPPTFKFPSEPW